MSSKPQAAIVRLARVESENNTRRRCEAHKRLDEVYDAVTREGFYGFAEVRVIVQDGHAQHVGSFKHVSDR